METMLKGFSKLNRAAKVDTISKALQLNSDHQEVLTDFFSFNPDLQKRFEGFSENVISSYPFPFSIAPNFLINGKLFHVPMVTEESSVVAAASYAARFWAKNGGFKCKVLNTEKIGQIFFTLDDQYLLLKSHLRNIKQQLINAARPFTKNMEERGGGIVDIRLKNFSEKLMNAYQLEVSFKTADSMGANFINTCLEAMAAEFQHYMESSPAFEDSNFEIIMAILSNYTPECLVEVKAECPVEALNELVQDKNGERFARRFVTAIEIAQIDLYRATTHNKGIYNGISAVALATANDFRAIEAAGHAYAGRKKGYGSLSKAKVENGIFTFKLKVPLAVGTVGGLTKLHPMSALSFEMLDNPNAKTLMKIMAAAGLANHFAAIKSLVTTGIQAGHMKMHLNNILQFEKVTDNEKEKVIAHFNKETVTYNGVKRYLNKIRRS